MPKKETPQPIGSTYEVFRNCSFPQLLLLQNADLNNRLLRSIMIDQPNTILVSVDKSYLVLQALAFYFFCSVLQAPAFYFFYLNRRNKSIWSRWWRWSIFFNLFVLLSLGFLSLWLWITLLRFVLFDLVGLRRMTLFRCLLWFSF